MTQPHTQHAHTSLPSPDPRLENILTLARAGLAGPQIGATLGLSSSRIHQLLTAAGHLLSTVRIVRCASCRVPLPASARAQSLCAPCRAAAKRVRGLAMRAAGRQRARCHNCQALLRLYDDARPHFCTACHSARLRLRWLQDPAYREYVRGHLRARHARRVAAKQRATCHACQKLLRRYERPDRPTWCGDCRSARVTWLRANDPEYVARQRRTERQPPHRARRVGLRIEVEGAT